VASSACSTSNAGRGLRIGQNRDRLLPVPVELQQFGLAFQRALLAFDCGEQADATVQPSRWTQTATSSSQGRAARIAAETEWTPRGTTSHHSQGSPTPVLRPNLRQIPPAQIFRKKRL